VAPGADFGHADRLPFEVADRVDSIGGEQLVAADVAAAEQDDRIARVDLPDPVADEPQRDVDVTCGERAVRAHTAPHAVLHVGEAFCPQQILGDQLRSHAEARVRRRWAIEPDRRRLRRRLGERVIGTQSHQPSGSCEAGAPKELAAVQPIGVPVHTSPPRGRAARV